MTMVSGGHSLTSRLWRLAPRTRMGFTMPGFGTMANIFDPEAAKSATQNAVQEGVNRGLKKAFGW
ncbi:MAG: hypothetical protein ACOYOU_05475 [Kiritimatiellia bacterium]